MSSQPHDPRLGSASHTGKRKRNEDEELDDVEEGPSSSRKRTRRDEKYEDLDLDVTEESTSSSHKEHSHDSWDDEESESDDDSDDEEPESEFEDIEPGLTRSKYWFKDGNLIINVEDMEFCVHRSMLSRLSRHFAKVIRKKSGQYAPLDERSRLLRGHCDVLDLDRVAGVKARDFEHLLAILYDDIRVYDMRTSLPLDVCAALIRVGRKLKIKHIRNEGLARFRSSFPSKLEAWDKVTLSEPGKRIKNANDVSVLIDALTLVHELSLPRLIPAICMALITNRNSNRILEHLNKDLPEETFEMIKRCLGARDRILGRINNALCDWLYRESDSPVPAKSCDKTECYRRRVESILSLLFTRNLQWFQDIMIMEQDRPKFEEVDGLICKQCSASMQRGVYELRAEIWQSLPGYLGLGKSWDVVVNNVPRS